MPSQSVTPYGLPLTIIVGEECPDRAPDRWTVRVNGHLLQSFEHEVEARELANRLSRALREVGVRPQSTAPDWQEEWTGRYRGTPVSAGAEWLRLGIEAVETAVAGGDFDNPEVVLTLPHAQAALAAVDALRGENMVLRDALRGIGGLLEADTFADVHLLAAKRIVRTVLREPPHVG